MRFGVLFLIAGLVLLLNSSSEHVPRSTIYSKGEVDLNETYSYAILIAPVGIGNITIGFLRHPGSNSALPPGINETVILPIHLRLDDPTNQTIFERDVITPYSFMTDFKTRGNYNVYITNKGMERTIIPIGIQFEQGNPLNKEADKFLLSIILSLLGIAFIFALGITKLLSKQHT